MTRIPVPSHNSLRQRALQERSVTEKGLQDPEGKVLTWVPPGEVLALTCSMGGVGPLGQKHTRRLVPNLKQRLPLLATAHS